MLNTDIALFKDIVVDTDGVSSCSFDECSSSSTSSVVDELAQDNAVWVECFARAFEKMLESGGNAAQLSSLTPCSDAEPSTGSATDGGTVTTSGPGTTTSAAGVTSEDNDGDDGDNNNDDGDGNENNGDGNSGDVRDNEGDNDDDGGNGNSLYPSVLLFTSAIILLCALA